MYGDDWPTRPPVNAQPPMTAERIQELRQVHRSYRAEAGILCLGCSLPNIPGDVMAPVATFYPCVFVRLFEFFDAPASSQRSDDR